MLKIKPALGIFNSKIEEQFWMFEHDLVFLSVTEDNLQINQINNDLS